MPDGHVHDAGVTAVAVTLSTVTALQLAGTITSWHDLVPMVGGSLIGWVMSPDLDIDKGFIAFHQVESAIPMAGWVVSHFFRLYWLPYSLAIPHRGLLSHAPVLSTLIRILYLLPVTSIIIYILQLYAYEWLHFSLWDYALANSGELWHLSALALIGLILADTCHFLLDWAHGQHGKDNRDGL